MNPYRRRIADALIEGRRIAGRFLDPSISPRLRALTRNEWARRYATASLHHAGIEWPATKGPTR